MYYYRNSIPLIFFFHLGEFFVFDDYMVPLEFAKKCNKNEKKILSEEIFLHHLKKLNYSKDMGITHIHETYGLMLSYFCAKYVFISKVDDWKRISEESTVIKIKVFFCLISN